MTIKGDRNIERSSGIYIAPSLKETWENHLVISKDSKCSRYSKQMIVVVVYFILSRLLYLAFSANLGLPCMPHPGMGPLV